MTNTGIVEGAFTALSLTSNSARPPAIWQFAAICANSVVPFRSRVSARQICPLVAGGKSVSKAPPLVSKTKFAMIGELMSLPALEVVDQTAGIQFGFTAQPSVFAGCGPPPRMSTLFCAAAGATLNRRIAPQKNASINLFIFRLIASRSHVMAKQIVATVQTTPIVLRGNEAWLFA